MRDKVIFRVKSCRYKRLNGLRSSIGIMKYVFYSRKNGLSQRTRFSLPRKCKQKKLVMLLTRNHYQQPTTSACSAGIRSRRSINLSSFNKHVDGTPLWHGTRWSFCLLLRHHCYERHDNKNIIGEDHRFVLCTFFVKHIFTLSKLFDTQGSIKASASHSPSNIIKTSRLRQRSNKDNLTC